MRTSTARVCPTKGRTMSSFRPFVSLQGPAQLHTGVNFYSGPSERYKIVPNLAAPSSFATGPKLTITFASCNFVFQIRMDDNFLAFCKNNCFYFVCHFIMVATCKKAVDDSGDVHKDSLVDSDVGHNTLCFALHLGFSIGQISSSPCS